MFTPLDYPLSGGFSLGGGGELCPSLHNVSPPRARLGLTGPFIRTLPPILPCYVILRSTESARPRASHRLLGPAATALPYLFRKTCLIYGLELPALVFFFEELAATLRGPCLWIHLDNNNRLAALVRGDSKKALLLPWWAAHGSWFRGAIFERRFPARIRTSIPLIFLRAVRNSPFDRNTGMVPSRFDPGALDVVPR